MILTQENIINHIADTEDIDVATVREVFKATENIIFDYLSSISPTEKVMVKPLSGLTIERNYIDKQICTKGLFKNTCSPAHVKTKAVFTNYYNSRLNKKLFN